MTDAEKVKWFDKTITWLDTNWGSPDVAAEAVNYSRDAAYDLFYDIIEQYDKIKKEEEFMSDWKPDYSVTPQVIVCAAIHKDGRIITGARHFDGLMRGQILASEGFDFWRSADQGFVDQFGQFLTRKEAWKIAKEMNQIKKDVSIEGTLYSENLY